MSVPKFTNKSLVKILSVKKAHSPSSSNSSIFTSNNVFTEYNKITKNNKIYTLRPIPENDKDPIEMKIVLFFRSFLLNIINKFKYEEDKSLKWAIVGAAAGTYSTEKEIIKTLDADIKIYNRGGTIDNQSYLQYLGKYIYHKFTETNGMVATKNDSTIYAFNELVPSDHKVLKELVLSKFISYELNTGYFLFLRIQVFGYDLADIAFSDHIHDTDLISFPDYNDTINIKDMYNNISTASIKFDGFKILKPIPFLKTQLQIFGQYHAYKFGKDILKNELQMLYGPNYNEWEYKAIPYFYALIVTELLKNSSDQRSGNIGSQGLLRKNSSYDEFQSPSDANPPRSEASKSSAILKDKINNTSNAVLKITEKYYQEDRRILDRIPKTIKRVNNILSAFNIETLFIDKDNLKLKFYFKNESSSCALISLLGNVSTNDLIFTSADINYCNSKTILGKASIIQQRTYRDVKEKLETDNDLNYIWKNAKFCNTNQARNLYFPTNDYISSVCKWAVISTQLTKFLMDGFIAVKYMGLNNLSRVTNYNQYIMAWVIYLQQGLLNSAPQDIRVTKGIRSIMITADKNVVDIKKGTRFTTNIFHSTTIDPNFQVANFLNVMIGTGVFNIELKGINCLYLSNKLSPYPESEVLLPLGTIFDVIDIRDGYIFSSGFYYRVKIYDIVATKGPNSDIKSEYDLVEFYRSLPGFEYPAYQLKSSSSSNIFPNPVQDGTISPLGSESYAAVFYSRIKEVFWDIIKSLDIDDIPNVHLELSVESTIKWTKYLGKIIFNLGYYILYLSINLLKWISLSAVQLVEYLWLKVPILFGITKNVWNMLYEMVSQLLDSISVFINK
jgi:hypothetical protein